MKRRGQPDTWTTPSKQERLRTKEERSASIPEVEMSLDQRLNLAIMDQSLPVVDFHGKVQEDVEFEIDQLLDENAGRIVRIIYGNGSGAISSKVMSYLHRLSRGKNQRIEGYREDPRRASCVAKVK